MGSMNYPMTPEQIILVMLRRLARDSGPLAAALMTDTLLKEELMFFAHRLVDLAEAIRDYTEGIDGTLIVKGERSDVERSDIPREASGEPDALC